jgi:hypothetical protein
MTYTIKPSDIYRQGREEVAEVLGRLSNYQAIDFRPQRAGETFLTYDTLRIATQGSVIDTTVCGCVPVLILQRVSSHHMSWWE